MKRIVLLLILLGAYGGFLERRLASGGPPRLDALAPRARRVEQAIGTRRFADALPLALELRDAYPREPLPAYWLAVIYGGLDRPADETAAWESYISIGSAPAEACPAIADAYARLGDRDRTLREYERCVQLDPRDPERLIDLAAAFDRAARPDDALATYQRAAALDPRNPVIGRRVDRLTREGAVKP